MSSPKSSQPSQQQVVESSPKVDPTELSDTDLDRVAGGTSPRDPPPPSGPGLGGAINPGKITKTYIPCI